MSAEFENKTNKLQVITLGGCVNHEIGVRLDQDYYHHVKHLWRRPTIALVSDPVENYNFKTSIIPNRYVSYFINDVSGFHFNELKSYDRESIIVMEILRDVHTGVVEIGENKYALNPVDGIGLLHDMTHKTMSNEILSEILRVEKPKTINPIVHPDEHFELWCKHVIKLTDFLQSHFRDVIVPEAYFLTESLELHDGHKIDTKRAERVNAVLSRMYDFLRNNTTLKIASVPKHRLLTASEVPWGGPSATHIIEETYALYCAEIDRLIRGLEAPETFYLERAAYKRAQQHANEQKQKLRAQKKVEELTQELAGLNNSIAELRSTLLQANNDNTQLQEQLKQNLKQTLTVMDKLTAAQAETIQARNDILRARHEAMNAQTRSLDLQHELSALRQTHHDTLLRLEAGHRRIDALKAELRKPLAHHIKKSVARTTRRLRGASQ